MRKLFTPHIYIKNYQELRSDVLLKHGIKVLVCDIDNTLVAHDCALPDAQVKAFIQRIQDAGIQVVLVSNNVKERVERFAQELNVRTYPFARKPLPHSYRQMMRDAHCDAKEIAVLGDQLLTDMLGANHMGFFTILTTPVAQRDLRVTKLNRIVEHMIFWLLAKQGKLYKGVYYGQTM